MIIRKKEFKDCDDWIDVHTRSWMLLDGVVSPRILNILLESRDLRIKREREDFCSSDWNFVLEKDNHVIGIMILKKSNRVGFENCGEIDALYLDPNEIGKGYGKLLFLKACEEFQRKGYSNFIVGCLNGNPSNGFYQHIGGQFIRQDSWDVLEQHYMENVYKYSL